MQINIIGLISLFLLQLMPCQAANYRSAKDVYSVYKESLRQAPLILAEIKKDKALAAGLELAENRAGTASRQLVSESRVASVKAVRYYLTHSEDFLLENPGGSLACSVNSSRFLTKLESFGPSKEAWELRSKTLIINDAFVSEIIPWCEGECSSQSFDDFFAGIQQLEKFYSKNQYRQALRDYRLELAKKLELQLVEYQKSVQSHSSTDPEAGKINISIVKSWIQRLRS